MFFKDNNVEYWDVFPDWSEDKVLSKAEEYGVDLPQDSVWNRWATFANVFGREHGLSDLEASSMASIVSGVYTGLPVSAGTEVYFDEDEILHMVLKVLSSLDQEYGDELVVRRKLFDYIFSIYRDFIIDYAFKTKVVHVRVNPYEMEVFQSVPGRTNADKFRALLNFWEGYD